MHKRATLAEIAKDPDALTGLDIADLRELWALHFPKKPPSPNRGCLIRDLFAMRKPSVALTSGDRSSTRIPNSPLSI